MLRARLTRPVVAALALALTPVGLAQTAEAATGPRHVPAPSTMAVLGDSISRGFDACGVLQECVEVNWSTGTNPGVASHASRIKAVNPDLQVFNNAVVGGTSALLPLQAAAARAQQADYVEVAIGANDACTPTVAAMTPMPEFRANVAGGLAQVRDARVFVASVPNLYRLWEVAKDVPQARSVWQAFSVCQSMLADPLSTERADRQRRKDVRKRIAAYNDVLREECAKLPTCRYDHGEVYKADFDLSEVSPIDFFHPSVAGQAAFSARTWEETYRFGPRS